MTAITSLFECSICNHPYEKPSRRPKVLPCGHTFCQQCLSQVQNCPVDREIIRSSALNCAIDEALDPGRAILAVNVQVVAQVKNMSLRRPPIADTPENIELFLSGMDELLQPTNVQSDGTPQCLNLAYPQDNVETLKKIIQLTQKMDLPDLTSRAQFLLALLRWAGDREEMPTTAKELFLKVAESGCTNATFLSYSQFASALAEIHPIDGITPIHYGKARHYFILVAENEEALPIHRAMARFYLACFHLEGLGGAEQSYEKAYDLFIQANGGTIQNLFHLDSHLPPHLKNFTQLLFAEFALLGIGGVQKDLRMVSVFLEKARQSDTRQSPRLSAKIYYWLGLLCKNGEYLTPANSEEMFRIAYFFLRYGVDPSIARDIGLQDPEEPMQPYLEKIFNSRDLHLGPVSNIHDTRGPHYERYLNLHLDPDRYQNTPGKPASLLSTFARLKNWWHS